MSNLLYKDAVKKDLERIIEIYNSVIPSRMVTADTEPVSVDSRIKWFEEHNSDKRPLWMVMNKEGNIIGWVSFQSFYGRPAYDTTVEISIYLDQNYRGKGYGKQILEYCIQQSPFLGIKTLLGFIFAHNEPSLRLFEAMGFEEWAMLPEVAIMEGKQYGLKILGKKV